MRNYTKNLKKRKITRKKNKRNRSKKRGGMRAYNSGRTLPFEGSRSGGRSRPFERSQSGEGSRSRQRSRSREKSNFENVYGETIFFKKHLNIDKFGKVYAINVHGERISNNPAYQRYADKTDAQFNWPVIYFAGTNCLTATNVGGWECSQMNSSIQDNMTMLLGKTQEQIAVDNMYLQNDALDNYMLTSARNHMDTTYNEITNCSGILHCDPVIFLGTGNDIKDGNINTEQISEIQITGRIADHADGRQLTLNDALHLIESDFERHYKTQYNENNIACIVFVVHCREQQGFDRSYQSQAEALRAKALRAERGPNAAAGPNTLNMFSEIMQESPLNYTFNFSRKPSFSIDSE